MGLHQRTIRHACYDQARCQIFWNHKFTLSATLLVLILIKIHPRRVVVVAGGRARRLGLVRRRLFLGGLVRMGLGLGHGWRVAGGEAVLQRLLQFVVVLFRGVRFLLFLGHGASPCEGTTPPGSAGSIAQDDDMQPARPMGAQHDLLLDIAGARGAGDEVDRARRDGLAIGRAQAIP